MTKLLLNIMKIMHTVLQRGRIACQHNPVLVQGVFAQPFIGRRFKAMPFFACFSSITAILPLLWYQMIDRFGILQYFADIAAKKAITMPTNKKYRIISGLHTSARVRSADKRVRLDSGVDSPVMHPIVIKYIGARVVRTMSYEQCVALNKGIGEAYGFDWDGEEYRCEVARNLLLFNVPQAELRRVMHKELAEVRPCVSDCLGRVLKILLICYLSDGATARDIEEFLGYNSWLLINIGQVDGLLVRGELVDIDGRKLPKYHVTKKGMILVDHAIDYVIRMNNNIRARMLA